MKLTEASLRNPAAVAVVVAMVCAFGLMSLGKLPLQLFPDIERPQMSIQTGWRAASPQEMESEIVEPIETVMQGLPGLEEMASNVIKYGYDDDREHEIAVHVAAQDDRVEIVFEDDGHAFDPTGHPKPDLERIVESRKIGGLGIELVRRICENMSYQRVGDRNRLVLHIRRFEAHDTQLLSLPQGIPS